MNITGVNLLNVTYSQPAAINRRTYCSVPVMKFLQADTVSFSGRGSAPNAESLRKLLRYGIPDMYSDVILIDSDNVKDLLKRRVFSKSLRSVYRVLRNYRDSLFPVEKEVLSLIKAEAKRSPKSRLDEFIHKLVPYHSKKLSQIQQPIFAELDLLASQMPPDLLEQYNYLRYITNKKLSNEPVFIPFSVKEFQYKLGRIKERIAQTGKPYEIDSINKIIKLSNSVADISKEKRLSSNFPMKKYERRQLDMVLKVSDYFERSLLKENKELRDLIEVSKSKVYKVPTNIKFNRKSFIYELQKITDRLEDKKLARRLEQVAVKLPTSKDNLSAFIMKAADRSAEQIGYDLLSGSIGAVDHLLAHHYKRGLDNIDNYGLSSAYMNSKKAHMSFSIFLRKNPEISEYCQAQTDRLIELANVGVFEEIGFSPNYIRSFARQILKLTKDDAPLILDTNALKY